MVITLLSILAIGVWWGIQTGLIKLPVAVINHGNTVKHTEYSFLSNVFAARGYLVVAPQHDLPTDPPMVTRAG